MHPGRVKDRTLEGSGESGRGNGTLASLGSAFVKGVQWLYGGCVCGLMVAVCSG